MRPAPACGAQALRSVEATAALGCFISLQHWRHPAFAHGMEMRAASG
jgi:hypothetical protein